MSNEFIKVTGKPQDLGGGFKVFRVLPQIKKRMVGPFVFFDHMGPVHVKPGQNIDVRPHPHIGLSTLTYMLEGRMVHCDSLGNNVTIVPGDVNWMTAGNGIAHSERAHKDDKAIEHTLQGLQLWVALPDHLEDVDPSFAHYAKTDIPTLENEHYTLSLAAGEAFGLKSPVKVSSPLILASIISKSVNLSIDFHFKDFEIGVYVVKGSVLLHDTELAQHEMLFLPPGANTTIEFGAGAKFVLLGGEPFKSPRHIWWNMVSSSPEKIEIAKQKWKDGTFPMVPGETEFIPAPDR